LSSVCLTLDLRIESVYQTQWLSRIKAQQLLSKAQEPKAKTFKTCILIICIIGSRADDLERRNTDDAPRNDGRRQSAKKTDDERRNNGRSLTSREYQRPNDDERRNNDGDRRTTTRSEEQRPSDYERRQDDTGRRTTIKREETMTASEDSNESTDESIISSYFLEKEVISFYSKR